MNTISRLTVDPFAQYLKICTKGLTLTAHLCDDLDQSSKDPYLFEAAILPESIEIKDEKSGKLHPFQGKMLLVATEKQASGTYRLHLKILGDQTHQAFESMEFTPIKKA